jgi:Pentapeptide repeats (8 copies)
MFRLWWKYIKQHRKAIGVTVLILAVVIVLVIAGYSLNWTGFKGKTIWDWLNLLGVLAIPVVVGLGTAWLSSQQAQEDALQRYLDTMADLLLDEKLRESKSQAEVRAVARTRTWTVLRSLDPGRRKIVFTFLVDSDLLSIIDLSRADFSGMNLRGVDLRGVNLSEANLQDIDLRGADLSGAALNFANMQGARLGGANLNGLDFIATRVTKDQLLEARSLKGTTMPDGSIHS